MKLKWPLIGLFTPLAAIRAIWLWRWCRYGWITPLVCLILWSLGLDLWFAGFVPFWLSYVLAMFFSWWCISISNSIMKWILQKHIFLGWEATKNLKDAWARLANLLAVHPNKEIALSIFGEAVRSFEFIQSTSPFVRDAFRPNPLQLNDPTEGTIDGWGPLVFTDRAQADPRYLALGPEIEEAVSRFYFLFSMASTACPH
jgi:hypothetical protein